MFSSKSLSVLMAAVAAAMTTTITFTQAQTLGTDYIDVAPATVYEAAEMSPQNMDFDAANNMFIAHSGWYNDNEIHYYKFRIFAPGTYPGTWSWNVEREYCLWNVVVDIVDQLITPISSHLSFLSVSQTTTHQQTATTTTTIQTQTSSFLVDPVPTFLFKTCTW